MGLSSASEICMCMCDPGGWRVRERGEELRDDIVVRERVRAKSQGICVRTMSAPKISSLD